MKAKLIKLLRNKHFKFAIGCALISVFFTLIKFKANPQHIDLFILFFLYIFILIEIITNIWNKIIINILNKAFETNVRRAIIIFIIFYVLMLIIALLTFLVEMLIWWLIKGYFDSYNFKNHFIHMELSPFLIVINFLLLISIVTLLLYQWMDFMKQKQKDKEEKLTYQYNNLKNQLNPHFLFNSFNTLSSIISENSDIAEIYVNKLSMIYRYLLNSSNIDLIPLMDEINFTEDYFYLNKIRDEEKIVLDIKLDSSIGYRIIPVSLQLLVENALKHNIATTKEPLKIEIQQYGDAITVSNNLQLKNKLVKSQKQGLSNLNERLNILVGKQLIIKKTETKFSVTVPLTHDQK